MEPVSGRQGQQLDDRPGLASAPGFLPDRLRADLCPETPEEPDPQLVCYLPFDLLFCGNCAPANPFPRIVT
jgi:hypothetical protein